MTKSPDFFLRDRPVVFIENGIEIDQIGTEQCLKLIFFRGEEENPNFNLREEKRKEGGRGWN